MVVAKTLEKGWQGIPVNAKGEPTENYIEYLGMMFSPKIAQIVKHLEVFPATSSIVKLAKKANLDKNSLKEKLEEVIQRGFVFNLGTQYALPPPMMVRNAPFIIEKNYGDPHFKLKEFAEVGRKWFEGDKYYKRWETTQKGTPRMRVVTVSEEVEPTHQIAPIEEIYAIIDQNDKYPVVVFPCPCRQRWDALGERKCKDKYPIHNCLNIGPHAMALLQQNDPNIKIISKEEAKKITRQAAELGLVHAIDNTAKMTSIICACCECCCGILAGLTRFDNPRAIAKANFIANVDEDLCAGCGTCENERCKFKAITVDIVAKVNVDRCMGCGLCAVTCPQNAIVMKRMERERIPGLES